jgi:Tol biopolymer transport system component/predicted Ser/Thr protein kinase
MIGRTIDRYQVVEALGQGGMGVVYKARDTLLDRFVALKVLPPDKSSDPERRRRFLHEAKSASALNHPGIVAVHDVRTVDGQDVIVMELVEGETLEQLLARKRLALGETLGLAARIADAVARAHAAGIVHRDLKPSNVMVTADGVKVLDFGLAKLTEAAFAGEDAPTLEQGEPSLTRERVILGTLAYMSPEQASGRPVDARSDIFAFGVLLYEMLTGRHPFRRKTALETLSAIREGEPEAPTRLVPGLPPEAERAVLRCLRKEPRRRWQSLSDLGTVLQDLKEDSESGRTVVVAGARPRVGVRRGRLLAAGAVVLLGVGIAAAFFHLRRPSAEEPAPMELSRLTYDGGADLTPTISSDGKLVAYASDRAGDGQLDIWVRHIAQPQPARLTDNPADDWQPSFAPDGSRIAFRSERDGGGIYLVNVLGGPARRLVSGGIYPRFSPDGTRVLYMDDLDFPPMGLQRMFLVSVEGGEPTPVLPGFGAADLPQGIGPLWSPDGERILFVGGSVEKPGKPDWWVAPVEGGEPVSTGASENLPPIDMVQFPCAWLPGGQLLFLAGSTLEGFNLYTAPLSDAGRVEGPPHRLTAGPGLSLTPSVAGDGRIALERLTSAVRLWEATLDPRTGRAIGEARVLTADATPKFGFSLARDGSLLAFSEYSGPRHEVRAQIRLRHLDSGQETVPVSIPTQLINLRPCLSPNGQWLAWSRFVDKRITTVVAPTGEPTGREVCQDCAAVAFLSEASELLVQRGRRLARIRLADGVETPVLDVGQERLFAADVSADEKWVALSTGRPDGHVALHVIRLDTPPDSLEKGTLIADGTSWTASPRWSPDGRFLYYLSDRDGFNCVWATPLDPRTKGPSGEPFPVLHAHRSNMNMALPAKIAFSIAISARSLVLNASDLSGEIYTGLLEAPE